MLCCSMCLIDYSKSLETEGQVSGVTSLNLDFLTKLDSRHILESEKKELLWRGF